MATKNFIGSWAFLIGVGIAVIFGFLASSTPDLSQVNYNIWFAWLLVLIGLVVGFLNVTGRETTQFLLSGAVLIIVSGFGAGAMVGVPYIPEILRTLLMIFVPATIIVAIKNVFNLAKN